MKPILDTATMRWTVKGLGTFANKKDALAAIEAKRMKNQLHLLVNDETYNALKRIAEDRETTITEVVREAIRKEVGL